MRIVYQATDIVWCVADCDMTRKEQKEICAALPKTVIVEVEVEDGEDADEIICDELSDRYGYLIESFNMERLATVESKTLRGWPLNVARVLDKLVDCVRAHGGYLVETEPYVRRTVYDIKDEFVPGGKIFRLRAPLSLSFVSNSKYIYVEMPDNPFFDARYVATYTDGKTIPAIRNSEILPNTWWKATNFEYSHPSDDVIEDAARSLFDLLIKSDLTTIRAKHDKKKAIRNLPF